MVDQLEAVFKRLELEQEEPEESGVKLNDLPELPFELILSYLSLEDRIKSRAVSRRWYYVINRFRPIRSLCYSGRPSDFIYKKNRWAIGEFVQNFISSTKFEQLDSFFQTLGQSILANLKHLRLCGLDLNAENTPASFFQIINSFGQLEELDLFRIKRSYELAGNFQVRLNLPMLKSVQLVFVKLYAIKKLTLDAPRLQNVKFKDNYLEMELVHGESVQKLIIDKLGKMKVSKMKNLKYLYCGEDSSIIDSTLLPTLKQLEEIHLRLNNGNVSNLFQQKAQYGRSNLKIFLLGLRLNAPDDPAIESLGYYRTEYLRYLAENPSKVAREIPLYRHLPYRAIEAVAPGLEMDLLKRFTNLDCITLYEPVQDVDRFLQLLKNLNNIVELDFYSDQPPELFDRLPDHCAVQDLVIYEAPADLNFLFRLKSLMRLHLLFSIDIELVRRVFEELPFFLSFYFNVLNKDFGISIDHSKQFTVWLGREYTKVSDVKAAVQWISEKAT